MRVRLLQHVPRRCLRGACGQGHCTPAAYCSFALAVFLTRPQAEHQIGATALKAHATRLVTHFVAVRRSIRTRRKPSEARASERRMVGATGIEPVTPTMSTWCSPAELRALCPAEAGPMRWVRRYRPATAVAASSGIGCRESVVGRPQRSARTIPIPENRTPKTEFKPPRSPARSRRPSP